MKTQHEIQRAHDLIVPALTGEIALPLSSDDKKFWVITANVLCWVLNHSHNLRFKAELESLEQLAKDNGYHIEFRGN